MCRQEGGEEEFHLDLQQSFLCRAAVARASGFLDQARALSTRPSARAVLPMTGIRRLNQSGRKMSATDPRAAPSCWASGVSGQTRSLLAKIAASARTTGGVGGHHGSATRTAGDAVPHDDHDHSADWDAKDRRMDGLHRGQCRSTASGTEWRRPGASSKRRSTSMTCRTSTRGAWRSAVLGPGLHGNVGHRVGSRPSARRRAAR